MARRRKGQSGKTSSEKIDVTTKANEMYRKDEQLTTFSVPTLGSIGSSRDGGLEEVDLPIACAMRCWTSRDDRSDGVVTVPSQGARSAVISRGEAAASRVAQHLRRDIARSPPPG
jgi:hypothetical protein